MKKAVYFLIFVGYSLIFLSTVSALQWSVTDYLPQPRYSTDLCPDPGAVAGVNPLVNNIYFPVEGFPTIACSGDDFRMIVDLGVDPAATTTSGWTIEFLSHSDGTDPQKYTVLSSSITVHKDYNYDLYRLTCQFPPNIVPDLYDVTLFVLVNSVPMDDRAYRAVKVVDSIKDTFYFAHMTDVHENDPRSTEDGYADWAVDDIIQMLNFLNPEFCIISGDLVYGADSYEEEYEASFNRWQAATFPTFKVPGNHDASGIGGTSPFCWGVDGLNYYKDFVGPPYYSFDYGDFHFIGLNSMERPVGDRFPNLDIWGAMNDAEMQWFETDAEAAHAAGKKIFVYLHHDPTRENTPGFEMHAVWNYSYNDSHTEFLRICRENKIEAVFVGHDHYDDYHEYQYTGGITKFVQTTTPASETRADGYWGFRLIKVENNEITTYDFQHPYFQSMPYADLTSATQTSPLTAIPYLDFELLQGTNNGTDTTVKLNVINRFSRSMDGMLRFRVLLSAGAYEVVNGVINTESMGSSQKIYTVTTTIAEGSEKAVTIRPGTTPPASPQELWGIARTGSVTLNWQQVLVSDLAGYRIYWGQTDPPIQTIDITELQLDYPEQPSWKISGLTNNTDYYFQIKAFDKTAIESAPSNLISLRPHIPPQTPGNFHAASGNESVTLYWDPVQKTVSGYSLFYGTTSNVYNGNDSNAGPSPIDAGLNTSFQVTGLENGQDYFFRVMARDSLNGGSELSGEVSAVPMAVSATGDVNNDGYLNEIDYKLLTHYLVRDGKLPTQYQAAVDMNEDGRIDLRDAVIIAQLAKGLNTAPVPQFTFDPVTADISKTITFDASASYDRESSQNQLQYRWDFTSDGLFDTAYSSEKTVTHSYSTNDMHTITLEVCDPHGLSSKVTRWILPRIAEHLILIDIDACKRDVLYKGVRDHFTGPPSTALPAFAEIIGPITLTASDNATFDDPGTLGANYGHSIFPTVTLATQATIFTGDFPGSHGIMGNSWFNRETLEFRGYTGNDVLRVFFESLANNDLQHTSNTIYMTHADYYPSGKSVLLFNQYSKGVTNWIIPSYTEFLQYLTSDQEYDNVCSYRAIEEIYLNGLHDIMTIYYAGHDSNSHSNGPTDQLRFLRDVLDYEIDLLINGGTVHYEFGVTDSESDIDFPGLKNMPDPQHPGKTLWETTVFGFTADHGQTGTKNEISHAINYTQINPITAQAGFNTVNSKDALENKTMDVDYNDYDAVYCENGGSAFFYIKNRNTLNWNDLPRFKEDTMQLAREFARENRGGRDLPTDCIEMIIVRKTFQRDGTEYSHGYYVYTGNGMENMNDPAWEDNYIIDIEEYFASASNNDEMVLFEDNVKLLQKLGYHSPPVNQITKEIELTMGDTLYSKSSSGRDEEYPNALQALKLLEDHRSGDLYFLSNYNESKSYDDGYYFAVKTYTGEHGNLNSDDINIPFVFAGAPISEAGLGGTIDVAGNFDFSPTAAQILGMVMPGTDGKGLFYDLQEYWQIEAVKNTHIYFPQTHYIIPNGTFNCPVLVSGLQNMNGFRFSLKYQNENHRLFQMTSVEEGYTLVNWYVAHRDHKFRTEVSGTTPYTPHAGNGLLLNVFFETVQTLQIGSQHSIAVEHEYIAEQGAVMKGGESTASINLIVSADSDADTLPDLWELQYTADLNSLSPFSDFDMDGVFDRDEYYSLTNPATSDSDEDGVSDYDEMNLFHTNPLNADTDGDNVSDGIEVENGSDPLNNDSFLVPDLFLISIFILILALGGIIMYHLSKMDQHFSAPA